ncbi:MAG: zinc-finger domain-containing protein [Gammaproteobacteria bacterium]|nr:zinc-finger domain-containing protein [Gammaproteobacteria bacterium]
MSAITSPYNINQQDLPLSCPLPTQKLWNAHPKVYLPIEKTGQAICPYCSTHYILKP